MEDVWLTLENFPNTSGKFPLPKQNLVLKIDYSFTYLKTSHEFSSLNRESSKFTYIQCNSQFPSSRCDMRGSPKPIFSNKSLLNSVPPPSCLIRNPIDRALLSQQNLQRVKGWRQLFMLITSQSCKQGNLSCIEPIQLGLYLMTVS